jgi:hypothetical protein
MSFDPTVKHPSYEAFAPSWQLMRDAMDGEDEIKSKGETYLPMKSGTRAIADSALRTASYEAYKLRAEFPELVAPTVRGSVGTILDQAASIELPAALEPLRLRATRDGLTLEALHRRITLELIVTGRYGLLPGMDGAGNPYLAGYVTEAVINWDLDDEQHTNFVMLDESGAKRDPVTGKWDTVEAYRECQVENGVYRSLVWTKVGGQWQSSDPVEARDGKRQPLETVPFVFINTNDLSPEPDDVPLYGLAKLAVRVYRLDADYTFALHMTSEPTPWVNGFSDAKQAITDGNTPTSIGSSSLWILPENAQAGFLEFTGAGLSAQEKAIQNSLQRAVLFGANLLADHQKTAESGEAIKLRLGNQTSTLKTIAMTSAAGLERALKNVATWMGESPDKVSVKPNLDFFDHALSPQEITAIVAGWQAKAYPRRVMFDRFQKGELISQDETFDTYSDALDAESEEQRLTGNAMDLVNGNPPPAE